MAAKIRGEKISPFLWFDTQAEEAVRFYTSIFKGSKILGINRYNEAGAKASRMPSGSVMTVWFQLGGQDFTAINGGPMFKFSPAISFIINCDNQEEIDHFWGKLTEGGKEGQCGWLTDKFGVSWQVFPVVLGKMLSDKDPEKVARVTEAFLKMTKFDIRELERAFEGKALPMRA